MTAGFEPAFAEQRQTMPGKTAAMIPRPDHGETSYVGSGRPRGKRAVITGGDSGIGRAVAIAFAREGADVLISYLNEDEDVAETADWVTEAGQKAVLMLGDIQHPRSLSCHRQAGTRGVRLHRYPRQQRRASGELRYHRRDFRRGMATLLCGDWLIRSPAMSRERPSP